MPKKLAITIAGAVSLGSYEAGVLWEVLDAIRQHNQNPATKPEEKVIIDVLTGASAGGMSAVILAQKLLFNNGDFKGPYDNPLYNAWVKRISLEGLQNYQTDENPLDSLFSSDLIEAISRETLTARYQNGPPPPRQPHPAVDGAVSLGIALTNLNGLPYTYEVTPSGEFTYIDYADQMTRQVVAATCDNVEFWEPLRQGAVACGAFPIAFRAQGIERSKAADPADYTSKNLRWDGQPRVFTYSDGGVLQNQPLGMAKNLVDPIDQHMQEMRFYMFVSPHAKDPTPAKFTPEEADYFQEIKRLIAVTSGQAGFQDWITARGVNKKIELMDLRAEQLAAHIINKDLDLPSLQTISSQLLKLFFPNGEQLSPGSNDPETLAHALARIGGQYKKEMADLAGIPSGPAAFCDSMLAFESAAGLGARDLMTIYGITATSSELAGAGLQAFLGFFDQKYRDHDYDVGRDHAQAVLLGGAVQSEIPPDETGATPRTPLGPLRFTPSPIRAIDHSLDGLCLYQVSEADLAQFKKGMETRVDQMIKKLGLAAMVLDPVANLIVSSIIKRAAQPPTAKP